MCFEPRDAYVDPRPPELIPLFDVPINNRDFLDKGPSPSTFRGKARRFFSVKPADQLNPNIAKKLGKCVKKQAKEAGKHIKEQNAQRKERFEKRFKDRQLKMEKQIRRRRRRVSSLMMK